MSKTFIFSVNKCVGCHACVVACSIENKTVPPMIWREVNTFNGHQLPTLPLFHHSLACNHCEDAPCMKNCPAMAYKRDPETGAVIHIADNCIGCKYCTWACPYDAPKYNKQTKIVEKCTFCNSRIQNNLKPSCANLCPTGALDFGEKEEENEVAGIQGFTDMGIKPSIKIISLRNNQPPMMAEQKIDLNDLPKDKLVSKILLKQEWVLAIFTLLVSILTGLVTATVFYPFPVNPYIFLGCGVAGIVMASFHIGKKMKAYRAVFHVATSWLSREILFYSLFLVSSGIYFLFFPTNQTFGWIASLLGFATLLSIDMVYHVARKPSPADLHSAHVFITGLFFAGLFMKNFIIFAFIGLIKIALYVYRKYYFKQNGKGYSLMASLWRVDLTVSFPMIIWWINPYLVFWYVTVFVVVGEIIDRFEYYAELDIITPKKQMETDFIS